ncbi:hypothetical protein [Thermus amyloliquefaciens]|uniref:hypothetical protein n=1 Tax=Thermus amyloliquefaciens TaxID=1449080 RepID=UPI00056EAAD7|nr:hypothetical protein [Thermus amyloliquefaciens]
MRKLVALMALLAGLALAQTTDNHTVTVNIPSILSLQIDATDFLFDFGDQNLNGTETVTVNGTPYTKASLAAYDNFIDNATGTQLFAPTSVTGTGGNDWATATVRSNRAQWTVAITSIGGTLAAPLNNGRVKVFAEKVSGKGASWTSVPTPVNASSPLTLFNAGSGGQGKSTYKLYYLLEMDINDDISMAGYSGQITLNYTLTSP